MKRISFALFVSSVVLLVLTPVMFYLFLEATVYVFLAGFLLLAVAGLIKISPAFYSVKFYQEVMDNWRGDGYQYLFMVVTAHSLFLWTYFAAFAAFVDENKTIESVLWMWPLLWFVLALLPVLTSFIKSRLATANLKERFQGKALFRFSIVACTPAIIIAPIAAVILKAEMKVDLWTSFIVGYSVLSIGFADFMLAKLKSKSSRVEQF